MVELIPFGSSKANEEMKQIANKYNWIIYKQGFVYYENSIFSFGKHENNILKLVYKVDPSYIEWCLINADGFLIQPDTINKLSSIKVFESNDINQYINNDGENFILDFSNFEKDINGLPISNQIREKSFQFSEIAIKRNLEKVNSNEIFDTIWMQFGGDFNTMNKNNVSVIRNNKKISLILK